MRLPLSYVIHPLRNVVAAGLTVVAAATAPATPVHAQSRAVRQSVPGAPTGVTAFVNVAVVPMDTNRVLKNQTVLVEGGRITALGPSGQVKIPAGATTIDGKGKYLIPGLADMHVHLIDTDSTQLGHELLRYVAHGVTTIRNLNHASGGVTTMNRAGGNSDMVLRARARAAAGEIVSPRIYTAGQWASRNYTNFDRQYTAKGAKHETAVRLDSIAAYVAAYQAAGYDFLKPYFEQDLVFDSVAAAARRLGLPMSGHVTGPGVTLERALASGAFGSIEHLTGYLETLRRPQPTTPKPTAPHPAKVADLDPAVLAWERAQIDDAKIPVLVAATKQAGVWNSPTLATTERRIIGIQVYPEETYIPGMSSFITTMAIMDVLRQIVHALQEAGAGLLLSSDALPDPDGGGLMAGVGAHQELQAMLRAGLTPYQALATGTKNVAAFFKTLDETGTIAVGKRADLVLLSGNPLQDIRHTREPAGVMLGGRWLDRAVLDQNLLLATSIRRVFYPGEWGGTRAPATSAPGMLLDDWLRNEVTRALPRLPIAQKTALEQLKTTHAAQKKALTDSLAPDSWTRAGVERQRVLRLVTEQLGALRTALTPEQQTFFFDPPARVFVREHARQGVRVAIPGVPPSL